MNANARDDSEIKHAQQHLANERTFLAWMRTTVAIMGISFVSAGLVFHATRIGEWGHKLSIIIGLAAGVMAIAILSVASREYFLKRDAINRDKFRTGTPIVLFATLCMLIFYCGLLLLIILFVFFR